jgi:hypothetical protein
VTADETLKVARPGSRAGDTLVVILFLGVSSLIVTKSLYYFDLNDSVYASAAARSGALYQDIHFVQAPLGYWFWHLIYLMTPSGYAYAAMRIVSSLLAVLAFIPPLFLLRANLQRAAFLLLAASSYYIIRSSFEIATYSLALALTSAGIALFMSKSGRAVALSGMLFGLAASAKINHVLLVLPALLFILLDRDSLGSRLRTAILFLALFGVGLLPILYYFLANPYAFYLHNVAFHSELTNNARGLTLMLSLKDIAGGLVHFANQHLLEIGLLATVLVVAVPAFLSEIRLRRWPVFATLIHGEVYRPIAVVLAFFLTALVMAVLPMAMFVQYLILPAFLLILGLVLSFELLPPELRRFALLGVCLIRGCQLVLEVPHTAETVLVRPTVLAEHLSVSKEIERVAAAHLVKPGTCEPSVFSVSASFVIDTPVRLSKYTEGGVFWSRLDGFVSDRYLRDARFNLDPNLLKPVDYLLSERIAYVLVGYHPDSKFEQEFAAAASGFTPFPVGRFQEQAMSLFVRDECIP